MYKRLIVISSLLLICLVSSGVMAAQKETAPAGILYTRPLESVIFSHQDHAQKDVACATCHSGLFEMEALQVQNNKDFNMDSLYKGKYCGACHNGKKAFASDTQCARCHLGFGARVPAKDAPAYKSSVMLGKDDRGVAFHHDTHVQQAACRGCHPSLFIPKEGASNIGMADHSQKKYCFTCHDQKGEKAFASSNCNRCHRKNIPAPQEAIKLGMGTKAVAFKHESHQLKAGCSACHPKLFAFKKGVTKIDINDHVNRKYCFTCHDQKGGKAFAWSDCNRCHQKNISAPKETVKFGKGTKAVAFKHESHQLKAGCMACHPKLFALKKGVAKIDFDDHINRQSCFTCHAKKNGTASYDCNRCHKDKPAAKPGGPDTLKYKTPMQNVYFHHESHAVFSCNMCHPALFAMKKGNTKMVMSEMLHGKTCGMCHNGTRAFDARACAKCHKN